MSKQQYSPDGGAVDKIKKVNPLGVSTQKSPHRKSCFGFIRNLVAQIAFDKIVIIATHVVSDIEFIAKEVLLMKRGEIIDSGAPHILCEKIDGKVFEITADESMLDEISAKYKVGNISKDEKNIYVRVISEQPPTYECKTCKPDLEDLYLYYFD